MAIATKHILIGDVDLLVQKTLKFSLEEAGYTVGLAKNGQEALRYIEAHHPSVVLLDVFMPPQPTEAGMTAYGAKRTLAARPGMASDPKRRFPGTQS
jgi:CheY-like chemotaxis protein